MAARRAFAELSAVHVDAAHPRVGRKRNEVRFVLGDFTAAQTVLLLRQHDDGSSFRRLIRKTGKLRGIGQLAWPSRRRRE